MHTTAHDQRSTLDSIKLKDGETKRIDCPFCGGSKTFTLSLLNGKRVWNCYKASCSAHGAHSVVRSLDTIRSRLQGPLNGTVHINPIALPPILSTPEEHERVLWYLEQVHSFDAYEKGLVDISYAPKENRVLFFMNKGEGAVGRALDERKPKWKVYGNTNGIFTCGTGKTAVLVEDAASACAVGTLPAYTGVSLLGTNMSPIQKRQLMSYERVVICLDNDASRKSVRILRKLEGLVPATVRFLQDDLKWLSPPQIEEVLRG